ncbi:MAG: tRNA (adenosine(37)-N6)-threonylcarbamoyltransferase complex dimerization subunit type 1 TsaB [Candidatus Margulisbacteria bacterium]|jgi:tRNA threonylcarbamoyladenosine biosynthesis protein TsaB|nr:tRNA (adenosine(37)-N6)-threonylcarbamoyltransferase complex dimerization subunit type 1 TsaB [Candidatus Margulisiibacteriota bacterium]
MAVLGFNFATENLGLAVSPDTSGGPVFEKIYRGPTIKAEFLLEYLDKLLKANNLSLPDISRIGTAIGPGAFTGLRLSLVTAKTLALELNIPLVPVPTLAALAHQCQNEARGQNIRVIMDACRGESAAALFAPDLRRLEPDRIVKTADAPREKDCVIIENRPAKALSVCALAAQAVKFLSRAEILSLAPAYSHGSRVNSTAKPELQHLKIGQNHS